VSSQVQNAPRHLPRRAEVGARCVRRFSIPPLPGSQFTNSRHEAAQLSIFPASNGLACPPKRGTAEACGLMLVSSPSRDTGSHDHSPTRATLPSNHRVVVSHRPVDNAHLRSSFIQYSQAWALTCVAISRDPEQLPKQVDRRRARLVPRPLRLPRYRLHHCRPPRACRVARGAMANGSACAERWCRGGLQRRVKFVGFGSPVSTRS
jgi:hypothetical protein